MSRLNKKDPFLRITDWWTLGFKVCILEMFLKLNKGKVSRRKEDWEKLPKVELPLSLGDCIKKNVIILQT